MSVFILCLVALIASGLTFFSGFGLGTLLLPAFSLFYPIGQAVALTAVVHFLNGLFKLWLIGRHTNLRVLLVFGLPALAASLLGAWVLLWLSESRPLVSYSFLGREVLVAPAKLVIGLLLLLFCAAELSPRLRSLSFPPRYFPIGGALSGFFGGLAGMQGALRSAFLVKAGLSKEQFIATGAAVAFIIDISRLSIYVPAFLSERASIEYRVLSAAVLAALIGSLAGNRFLKSVTMSAVQALVAIMLSIVGVGLISGVV
jgi:uncharacterized membrane protein YfcA